MNRTILRSPPLTCPAALADPQDFSFDEITRRTVEAINCTIAGQAIGDLVVPTRRTKV
jgi:hypothetical protein